LSLIKRVATERQAMFPLSLAALGVVYGDIGTSPLYAMRESLDGLPVNLADILGILSLIFWSLILIISIKYLIILFRADNDGEGGILALLALIKRATGDRPQLFFLIGIFGAGLMLGDGMLTPAISVISAIEGFNVILPSCSGWIIPLTCIILIALFSVQSFGTEKIGFIFGPVIFLWFLTLAILGALQIFHNSVVLKAVNPFYGFHFLYQNGWRGYTLLGGIFLVVTGGEALYADMGHFGKMPIRLSWFALVLPSLLLNYFGQGANLLAHPDAIISPFYLLAPDWFALPLIVLATLATIIASQAVISATFSLTKQAVLLGLYPHLPIVQTSGTKIGQIYVPQMNLILAIGTLFLILNFKSSAALTHAYGVAVNIVMLLTTVSIMYLALKKWHWNWFFILCLFTFFAVVDLLFLGANIQKLNTGGWMPITFAMVCAVIMYTWQKGRTYIHNTYALKEKQLSKVLKQLDYKSLHRLPNATAIFITDIYDKSGGSFLRFLKLNRTLPDHILMLSYTVENIPRVKLSERFETRSLNANICELTLHYGFMDSISIPRALNKANELGIVPFPINIDTVTYMLEIPNVVASREKKSLQFFWQEKLFAFLVRNYSANLNIEFYHLPYNRTVAIGTYYII
jgi:KUP system potassium uptake protein